MPESPADTIRRAAQHLRDITKDEPEGHRIVLATAAQIRTLADLFDAVATEMNDYGTVIEDAGAVKVAPAPDGFRYDEAPPWTKTLTAARALLGETP